MRGAPDGGEGRDAGLGTQWWSRRFLGIVESFADAERLRRGHACAREGAVSDLRVAPYEVTAKVRGDAPEPYGVALGIDAIDDAGWRAAERELSSRAVFRARLLTGELPPEIEWVFAELGLALFPGSASELHLMCDCADWGDPCEHAAAVLYALAEAFDDDPFLVLEWNGRGRDRLLAALRRDAGPGAGPDPFEMDGEPLTAAGFWTPPSGLAGLRERPPAPPVPPGFVLRVAAPPPVRVRRRDLADVLAPAYEALADDPSPE
ncbi:SWIM zinc finger family protein [Actinomadura graeca]|uniref:SWIM zinc finger family protein n=1 Tax=Actinomadura graeca TaxID=2750812 RepID=A0ABX8R1L1_9ACTN|nr:SWIM zinc finger family protein [Actinomadura graeca]QXJ24778.1 SWIM zinc finger family protein [Actinomadura graeca]